jgi:hypothetical protein
VVQADGSADAVHVPTVTLDDFVQQQGLDSVSFVKMDVEGVECKVLRGARGALREFAPKLAIAAYHKDDDLVSIPELIVPTELDWQLYVRSFSAVEAETVLFGRATRASSST